MISSRENPLFKKVIAVQRKKGRIKHCLFLAEGPHLIQEAINSPFDLNALIVEAGEEKARGGTGLSPEFHPLLQAAEVKGIPVHYVTARLFKEMAETQNPQGVLGLINLSIAKAPALSPERGFLGLIINGIQDPGNMGTILRTAWGAGITDIFITPGTVDPYSGKVVRSTQGGIFNLTVRQQPLSTVITWAAQHGVSIVSGDPRGAKVYYEYDFTLPTLILLGNEARGPEPVGEEVAFSIRIPLPGGAESLNVATAAGILIFEALRQRAN